MINWLARPHTLPAKPAAPRSGLKRPAAWLPSFTEWVVLQVRQLKMTHKELARRAKLSPPHLSLVLNGKRPWTEATAAKVMAALGGETGGRAAA